MYTPRWIPVALPILLAACAASHPGGPQRAAAGSPAEPHVDTARAVPTAARSNATPGAPATATAVSNATSGNAAMAGSSKAAPRCTAAQFVACQSGKQCARRRSEFVEPKECFDHAAHACTAAACEHGCDVYGTAIGGPKMVLCAPNASSTGNMRICGGAANWQCPEAMTCQFPPESARVLGARGRCVPST